MQLAVIKRIAAPRERIGDMKYALRAGAPTGKLVNQSLAATSAAEAIATTAVPAKIANTGIATATHVDQRNFPLGLFRAMSARHKLCLQLGLLPHDNSQRI